MIGCTCYVFRVLCNAVRFHIHSGKLRFHMDKQLEDVVFFRPSKCHLEVLDGSIELVL